MVLVTPVVTASLRSPVASQSSCLLKIYEWLIFVTKNDWKGSICLKHFLFSKFLEGEMCITARTTLSLLIYPYVALFKLHLHAKESPWRCLWSLLLQWSQQISPCWISPLQMCSRSVSQEPRFNKNELPDTWKFYMCSKKSNGMRVTVYL